MGPVLLELAVLLIDSFPSHLSFSSLASRITKYILKNLSTFIT